MELTDLKFKVTPEAEALSKRLFGKLIRVVIVNGGLTKHSLNNLEEYINEVAIFPDNYLSVHDAYGYIDSVKNDPKIKSLTVFTNCLGIISSVPGCLVRIIRGDKVVEMPNETFCGNQGELMLDMAVDKSYGTNSRQFVLDLVERIKTDKWKTDENEKNEVMADIELVADAIIYYTLYEKLGMEKRRTHV